MADCISNKKLFHEGKQKEKKKVTAEICHEVVVETLVNYFTLKGKLR